MRARSLTCKNHLTLRWSCKDIAWTERGDGTGFYNNERSIFFKGESTGELYGDGSGVKCVYGEPECSCDASELILAPEDSRIVVPGMRAYVDSECTYGYMTICNACVFRNIAPAHVSREPILNPPAKGKRQPCELCKVEWILE